MASAEVELVGRYSNPELQEQLAEMDHANSPLERDRRR